MAIVYKTSAINYKLLLRPLISVDHFGLVNLIAEKRIAKELIQSEFTADTLAAELEFLLDHDKNANARVELAAAVEKLGHGGASKRAADAILRFDRSSLINSASYQSKTLRNDVGMAEVFSTESLIIYEVLPLNRGHEICSSS